MESVARLSAAERRELFSEAAARKGMTAAVVEKDFWVCWTLGRLFAHPDLSRVFMFKGGTSLSKVFNLIERFSEDVDLVLDWRVVAGDAVPLADRSHAKQEALNKTIEVKAMNYIAGELLVHVAQAIAPLCSCERAADDPHALNVLYPAAFSDVYLRPEVRLEIGPLAAWLPYECYRIRPYAAEVFPRFFKQADCAVQAIRAERTFWEKATILHHEAHRPEGSPQPLRYSRHYYGMAMMASSPVKAAALADLALLKDVVAFKQRFYPRGWAQYDLARPGTFKLEPSGKVLVAVEKDYAQMRNMIFGRYPGFYGMMETLRALRFHSRFYVHGHQVGGTNPSLVEALGAGNAVLAHDNPYNRWVAGEAGVYLAMRMDARSRLKRCWTTPANWRSFRPPAGYAMRRHSPGRRCWGITRPCCWTGRSEKPQI